MKTLSRYIPLIEIEESTHMPNWAIDLAWSELFNHFSCGKSTIDSEVRADAALGLNVTLRSGGRILGSMSGRGVTLQDQIRSAVRAACNDTRFGHQICAGDLQDVSLELWIQISRDEMTVEQVESNDGVLGHDGFELICDHARAYYKPSVAITKGISSLTAVFRGLSKKASLEPDAWRAAGAMRFRCEWTCRAKSKNSAAAVDLNGLRPSPLPAISRESIKKAASLACDYFTHWQTASGQLAYILDPIRNLVSSRPSNIVRAGGCLYAICLAATKGYGGSALQSTAKRLAANLLDRTLLFENALVIADKQTAQAPKVGATALAVCALSQNLDLDRTFEEARRALLESLYQAQMPDGRFITNFGVPEPNARLENFYSGQVLLGLTVEAERGSERALKACSRAFPAYKKLFEASPATAFVGWHAEVWSRLAVLCKDQEYADFVFQQIDWLVGFQINETANASQVGGFLQGVARYPNYSSIVFTEAMISGVYLASRLGDAGRAEVLSRAVNSGLQFCWRLHLNNIYPPIFSDFASCRGGVAMSETDLTVRCDVVQHFLTLLLRAEEASDLLGLA